MTVNYLTKNKNLKTKMKVFITNGSNENRNVPYCTCKNEHGIEAHIVVAKSKERAMELICGSEEQFRESGLEINEFVMPDYEYSECICLCFEN